MPLSQRDLEWLIYDQRHQLERFTQDSPVYPDVWLAYTQRAPSEDVDVLLTPRRDHSAVALLAAVRRQLAEYPRDRANDDAPMPWALSTNGATVAAKLTFDELVRVALPLTRWWRNYVWREQENESDDLCWLRRIVAAVWIAPDVPEDIEREALTDAVAENLHTLDTLTEGVSKKPEEPACLWSVSLNRPATCQLTRSVPSTKADAARRVFDVDGSRIAWAVIDSGIDATHPAFRKWDAKADPPAPFDDPFEKNGPRWNNRTRIAHTYDFTRLRDLMSNIEVRIAADGDRDKMRRQHAAAMKPAAGEAEGASLSIKDVADRMRELEQALTRGRVLDWSVLAPLLQVPHSAEAYEPPQHPHGTHVAGIIGANLRAEGRSKPLIGMCPAIQLYDLRVFDEKGRGDEFTILAALQFVRWLNSQNDVQIVHGVNLSLSITHNVANFACGRTPVCEECQRVVAEGAVVVAAAGNRGRAVYLTDNGRRDPGFRTVSITDPGNAEAVITVGATHRYKPHTYGVSYFSSRGPTGDGRVKPDLLAPGEKIHSTVPGGGSETMDGTSMAAPHVSGAAALLLAEHREMIGQPARVKQTLCETATDLGRERYFQGAGVLDTLRAVQSI